jgi:RNA polymerase sigma factor (sigma-70 family)
MYAATVVSAGSLEPWGMGWLAEIGTARQQPAKVRTVSAAARGDESFDERGLVQRAKAGNRDALGQLLARHGPRLYRAVLLPRLGSEARARDALSATYERAIERLHMYEWQPCGLYPWLRVVALRIALDMIRASRHEVLFGVDDLHREIEASEASLREHGGPSEQAADQHDLEQARRRVNEALGRINPRYAQAIRLRVLEERSRELVAESMGVSTSTFDVLLHRSMAALKKALGTDAPGRQEP